MNCSVMAMRTQLTASWRNDPEPASFTPLTEPRSSLFLEPQNPNSQPREEVLKKFISHPHEGAGNSYFPFPMPNPIPSKSPGIPSCLPAWDLLTLIYFVS